MNILATVEKVMSHIKDSEHKHTTLLTACSDKEIYSSFYSNFPDEMKELNVASIKFEAGCIVLYVV